MKIFTLKFFLLFYLTTILFSTSLQAETGDSFDNAEVISVPSTITGELEHRWSNGRYYDYKFTAPASGTVHIYTTDLNYDTDIEVYDNDYSFLLQDTSSNNNVDITFSIQNNANYYLDLYNFKNKKDTYTLYIDFTPDHASANDDTYTTAPDTQLVTNASEGVLQNDSGADITITAADTASLDGSLDSFDLSSGAFSFTPVAGFIGTTSFTYTITDSLGIIDTAIVTIVVAPPYNESTGSRLFEKRHQESLFGDVTMIGNSVICKLGSSGSCENTTSSNGNTFLSKTPDSNSTLIYPINATVKYARLYWQGRNTTIKTWTEADKALAKVLRFKNDVDKYVDIIADTLDIDNEYTTYSASADVTDYISTQGRGSYSVDADAFYTITGKPDGLGAFGAWVLVVVYEDPDETTARNVTIFDGYQIIDGSNPIEISVSGFLTPKTGNVESKTYVFVGEGDKYITGDDLLMKGQLYNNANFVSIAPDADNAFNSRIDVSGNRTPNLENNNGIDIQVHNTGSTGADIITNNETGATFKFTTGGDVYFPSLLVFSTQLYLPQLCYDYSIRQDGVFLSVDRDAYPVAQLDGQISSSPLEVSVYLRNEEADIAAEGIALKMDINDSIFNHLGHMYTSNTNGSILIDRGTPSTTIPLCDYDAGGDNSFTNNGCTTGHDFRKGLGVLDAQEYIYTKFLIQPQNINGISDLNQSLGLSLKYYITADGNKVEYPDYVLGGKNIPLCPPTVNYQPMWGQFNVVETGRSTNNIYTQVSRKPFNVDVIFDSTPTSSNGDHTAPVNDINTTVLVEMIDLDSFGDINASCANPDSNVTRPIFVTLNFDSSNYQVTIPTQLTDYYNFATKNTAFRIWFFSDDSDILSEKWIANTFDSQRLNLSSISGLYDENKYPICSSECSDSTSTTCFNCIRANYAKPLCSRDNFSVRPESYDIRIYDDNQIIANSTKIDLSALYNYAPDSTFTPTEDMQLTTDYKYRFDIFATGHDSTLKVPRYTRYFNGAPDYNATLLWNSLQTGCNDVSSRSIDFYVNSGIMEKEQRSQDEIGEYSLNLIDKSWTAVDWSDNAHHIVSRNFTTTDDCQQNKSTTLEWQQNGCLITSNHGSDGGSPTSRFYRDLNITFHPYTFDIATITPTVGLNHALITANNSFVYMADMSQDVNMSYHLDGSIIAKSFTGNTLSNFVDNCYAQPLDISIARSDTTLMNENNNTVNYSLNFRDLNSSGVVILADVIDLNDTNVSTDFILQTTQAHFYKLLNGSMNQRLNLNFHRERNATVNPKSVTFTKYSVKCTTRTNCNFRANMQDTNLTAEKALNNTIIHYYGRSHSPRQKFVYPIGASAANPGVDFIYYEVFCNNGNGTSCDKTLLQNGVASATTDDPRWFVNSRHTSNFGTAGAITQKGGATDVTGTTATGNAPDFTNLVYAGARGYKFSVTMQQAASNWLIYNKYSPTATRNDFDVEFIKNSGSWAGKDRAHSTTNTTSSLKSNRRSMW